MVNGKLPEDLGLNMPHDFIISNTDTDSIMFSKRDGSPFSLEEQSSLIKEINALMPEMIVWDHDGIYQTVLILKAKNYALWDGKKIKIKGSALKGSAREIALKSFIDKTIELLLNDQKEEVVVLYNNTVKSVFTIQDIHPYCSKKTVTQKLYDSDRTNEKNVLEAIGDTKVQLGDKIWVYFDLEGKLKLKEAWNNDHDPWKLVAKLFNTIKIFKSVIDITQYPNYSLKKNRKLIEEL